MEKRLGIIDLLTRCGEEKLRVQFVGPSMTNITTNKRGESRITFATDQLTANDVMGGTGMMGIIVWVPAEDVQRAKDEHDAEKGTA